MLEAANSVKDGSDPMSEFEDRYNPEAKKKIKPVSIDELILKEKVKEYIIRRRNIENNIIKLYSLIWGQCTEVLWSAVKLNTLFEEN